MNFLNSDDKNHIIFKKNEFYFLTGEKIHFEIKSDIDERLLYATQWVYEHKENHFYDHHYFKGSNLLTKSFIFIYEEDKVSIYISASFNFKKSQSYKQLQTYLDIEIPVLAALIDYRKNEMPQIISINKSFTQTYGYDIEEVIGENPNIFQGEDTSLTARKEIKEALTQRKNIKERIVNYTKEGTPIIVELDIHGVKDKTGWTEYWQAFQKNISQETFEKQNRKTTEKITQLGYWHLDVRSNRVHWTPEVYHIYGLALETPIEKIDAIRFYAPHERERVEKCLEKCIIDKKGYDEIFEFFDKNGNFKWVRTVGEALTNKEGKVISLYGLFQDVTANYQKKLELKRLIDNLGVGLWHYDVLNDVNSWDQSMFDLYEIDKNDFNEQVNDWFQYVHPEDREKIINEHARILEENDPLLNIYSDFFRIITPKGKIKYLKSISDFKRDKKGQILSVSGINIDITEEVTIKQKLEKERHELERFWDSSTNLKCIAGQDGYFHKVNNAFKTTLGYSEQELLSKPILDFVHPEDRKKTATEIENLAVGQKVIKFINRYLKKSGDVCYLSWVAIPTQDNEAIYGTAHNVTELVKLNEQLQAYKNGLDQYALVSHSDIKGNILEINDLFCKTSGYSKKELIGKNHRIFSSDQHTREFWKSMWKTINAGKLWRGEILNKSKNGKLYWVDTTIVPLLDRENKITGFYSFRYDITSRKEAIKEAEQEKLLLLQASKLASIGELAAGVGHEINNPLTVAMGSIELLKREYDLIDDESINRLSEAHDRIKKISDGLRTYARSNESMKHVDLVQTLEKSLSFVYEIYKKDNVKIQFENNDGQVLMIYANEAKLQQLIMNLISNAKDATEGQNDRWIKITLDKENDKAIIKIKDNGCGISENEKKKIFENFYTTKEAGKGTGLGLAMVKNIINELSGKIEIESTVNIGTEFTLSIPYEDQSFKKDSTDQKSIKEKKSDFNIPGTVLIVDDEQDIRDLLCFFIDPFAEKIITASNGDEALEIANKLGEEIRLILSDIKMPKMGGLELFEKVKSNNLCPQTKYAFMSGGVSKKHDDYINKADAIIFKPFSGKEIEQNLKVLFG